MIDLQDITKKRWYMGKGRTPSRIEQIDELSINGTAISIVSIQFPEGDTDLYLVIKNENDFGPLLYRSFGKNVGSKSFRSRNGIFSFVTHNDFLRNDLESLKPISAEQSNSSFAAPEKLFFKVFRRLQAGAHPEEETLRYLSEQGYQGTPSLLGSCHYTSNDGNTYVLGILESLIPNTENAWDVFNREPSAELAFELGCETARMHKALREMDGCTSPSEEPPVEKLKKLLAEGRCPAPSASLRTGATGHDISNIQVPHPSQSAIFKPQRIHGDFHLGQVLVTPDKHFKIIDFEGEPTRTLDFRRGLRSPAVDIAGMIRSFAYAEAVSKKDMSGVRQAFIQGYAKTANIPEGSLQQELKPYIVAKAIYEACYELEFRPDWFWIPEKALEEFANPGE